MLQLVLKYKLILDTLILKHKDLLLYDDIINKMNLKKNK